MPKVQLIAQSGHTRDQPFILLPFITFVDDNNKTHFVEVNAARTSLLPTVFDNYNLIFSAPPDIPFNDRQSRKEIQVVKILIEILFSQK